MSFFGRCSTGEFWRVSIGLECDIRNGLRGVQFTTSKDGRPSGEAYVHLDNEADFKKAVAKDRKYMGHRYIEGR